MIDFEKIWGAFFPTSEESKYVDFEHKVTPGLMHAATFTSMMYQVAAGPPWPMDKDVLVASINAHTRLINFDSSLDLLSTLGKAPPKYPTYRRWGGAVHIVSKPALEELAASNRESASSVGTMLYVSNVILYLERDFKNRRWNEFKTNI